MTRVVNRRREPFDVYIGRGSPWGNPFSVYSARTREEAIERYRLMLWDRIRAEGEPLIRELASLHGKTLGCYCKPAPCHGDVLARAAEWATRVLA